MNPEFLRESSAIHDYYHPSHIVIGELDQRSGDIVEQVHKSVEAPIVRTFIQTAEMLKYVRNAFHALKVVFANEIGNLCKVQGAWHRRARSDGDFLPGSTAQHFSELPAARFCLWRVMLT